MSVSVITSLYILGMNIWVCATISSLIVRTSFAETCSLSLGPENAIFTVQVQFSNRDILFTLDPLKILCEVHHGSERKASYRSHVRDK